jgi:hypothetical protein
MRNTLKVTSVALLASISQLAYSAPITDTYTTGDTLTATTLGNIKSAVNDNDSKVTNNTAGIATNAANITSNTNAISNDLTVRLNALESGIRASNRTFINVDCGADADALTDLVNNNLYPYTTFNITGACDGPIYITTDGTWFVGDGVSTSSIVLPFDTTSPDTGAVTVSGGSDVRFQDLTFDVSAWSGLSAEGSDAGGVYARDAFVTLTDVNVTGGLWGINPYRNAIIRLEGTINVTNFVNEGITLGDQSTVQVRGSSTTVTVNTSNLASQSFTNGNYITGISAYRQGVLEVRGDLSVSVPSGKSALSVSDNSQIRVRSPAIGTFNGPIDISNSSVANLSNTVVNGRIHVNGGSTLDFKNSQKDSTNDIQAADNSTINISSGSIINDQLTALRSSVINVDSSTINDDLYAQDGSVINLGNVGLNNSNIELFTNSVIRTSGTTVITAQTVNVSGGAYLEFNDSTTLTFAGNINLSSGGILYAEGDANLGNAPIECASREMQVVISTAGSNNVSGVIYGTCP